MPDVVLITIDTLRVDHVGAFAANSPSATPNIDALAADGVAYSQALSPISVTGPAFVTLLTGQNPGRHGVVMNLFRGGKAVSPETVTLAERLAERGYSTGAFLSGFTLRPELGIAPGFQRYEVPGSNEVRRRGDRTAERAIEWLDEQSSANAIFLWYHSYDSHGPLTDYDEAAPILQSWERDPVQLRHIPQYQRISRISAPDFYRARYAASVEFADVQVGRIIRELKERDRYDEAVIVLTADHGETFTERELWFDHGTATTAEQLRVPLIVKYPGNMWAGTEADGLVSLADVAPTVLDIANMAPLDAVDGHSLRNGTYPRLVGESSHCKKEALLRCAPKGPEGKEFAIRTQERTVRRMAVDEGVVWQVFNRLEDPWERDPLAVEPSEEERAVLNALAARRRERDRPLSRAEQGVDDDERAALKVLGYVEE